MNAPHISIITLVVLFPFQVLSQHSMDVKPNDRKGSFYFYWGWNWEGYSKSNIRLKGTQYDFTLKKVIAKDRQSKFDLDTYFNPGNATIPQYNFRMGYFISHHYNISFGIDHMKYVVQKDQIVKISGQIRNTNTSYDGNYTDNSIAIKTDFLKYEHTDGLNFINLDFRRFDEVIAFKHVKISLTEGLGGGILFPRTDVTLLNNGRNDVFHVSGFGLSGMVGVNMSFYKFFFIQTEIKEGFISMPDIRTTNSSTDMASQHFFFSQINLLFGATFNLKHHKNIAGSK